MDDRERWRWEKRYLSFGLTLGETGSISGSCGDTASFEILRTAAEAFAPPGVRLDHRTAAQRRMDGLVAACKVALDIWCTGHHIPGWRNGARTSLKEMVLLCHLHHDYFVHLLGWTISGDPNGTLRFRHPCSLISHESPLPGWIHAP